MSKINDINDDDDIWDDYLLANIIYFRFKL